MYNKRNTSIIFSNISYNFSVQAMWITFSQYVINNRKTPSTRCKKIIDIRYARVQGTSVAQRFQKHMSHELWLLLLLDF